MCFGQHLQVVERTLDIAFSVASLVLNHQWSKIAPTRFVADLRTTLAGGYLLPRPFKVPVSYCCERALSV